jgi:hypothetical protein
MKLQVFPLADHADLNYTNAGCIYWLEVW